MLTTKLSCSHDAIQTEQFLKLNGCAQVGIVADFCQYTVEEKRHEEEEVQTWVLNVSDFTFLVSADGGGWPVWLLIISEFASGQVEQTPRTRLLPFWGFELLPLDWQSSTLAPSNSRPKRHLPKQFCHV